MTARKFTAAIARYGFAFAAETAKAHSLADPIKLPAPENEIEQVAMELFVQSSSGTTETTVEVRGQGS